MSNPTANPPAAPARTKTLFEFLRFLCVGVINTMVGLSVIYAAKYFGKLTDAPANALGYAVGLVVSFTLNRRWTFRHNASPWVPLLKFLGVAAVAYTINLLTVLVAIDHFQLNSYLAQALGIPPYTLTSYWLSRTLVFRHEKTR